MINEDPDSPNNLRSEGERHSSTIKPESADIIAQIAELLKLKAGLKLSIEGHADNQGAAVSNNVLSLNRAKAVIKAVTKGGRLHV